MQQHTLSKSNYIQYLDCPEELWLEKNKPDLIPVMEEMRQFKMEQGNIIDQFAQTWFPQEIHKYKQFVDGKRISFQDRVEINGFIVISDILVWHDEKEVSIIEVKSATKLKEYYLDDVAFQKMAFELANYRVRHTFVAYVNKEYIIGDEQQELSYLCLENVTRQVKRMMGATYRRAATALAFVNGDEPTTLFNPNCSKKENCPYLRYKMPDFPENSIFELARLPKNKRKKLHEQGVMSMNEIPTEFELSTKQKEQLQVAKQNQPTIDIPNVKKYLSKLKYPLYFLDYESYASVMPPQRGYRPYQQIVIQYSLHILNHPDAPLAHACYLSEHRNEPVTHLINHLKNQVHPTDGTIIVWNAGFERVRNKDLARLHPEYAEFMLSLNERMFDLLDIFAKGYYLHPAFKGKTSLKYVLPAFWKEISYQNLPIGDGSAAMLAWHKMTDKQTLPKERVRIAQNLHQYCHLDTLAMVKILEGLKDCIHE